MAKRIKIKYINPAFLKMNSLYLWQVKLGYGYKKSRGSPMFKVKTKVIDFLGDKEKYPCHHQYQIGDEFIFDGESFIGRICPSLAISVVPKMMEIHSAGPRYKDYLYYYPFMFSPLSKQDPNLKEYDGLGFANVFQSQKEPQYSMANLALSGAFKWPPPEKRPEFKEVKMICPDYRTSVVVKIEAFDLSDKGRNIPYFRREMLILYKILKKPGIKAEDVIKEFSKEEIEGIYPALSQTIVKAFLEELELMHYVEIKEDRLFANKQSELKLGDFKRTLSIQERKALRL